MFFKESLFYIHCISCWTKIFFDIKRKDEALRGLAGKTHLLKREMKYCLYVVKYMEFHNKDYNVRGNINHLFIVFSCTSLWKCRYCGVLENLHLTLSNNMDQLRMNRRRVLVFVPPLCGVESHLKHNKQ